MGQAAGYLAESSGTDNNSGTDNTDTPSGLPIFDVAANALTDDSGAAIAAGLYAFDDQNGTVTAVTGNATDGSRQVVHRSHWELARKQQWLLSQDHILLKAVVLIITVVLIIPIRRAAYRSSMWRLVRLRMIVVLLLLPVSMPLMIRMVR